MVDSNSSTFIYEEVKKIVQRSIREIIAEFVKGYLRYKTILYHRVALDV